MKLINQPADNLLLLIVVCSLHLSWFGLSQHSFSERRRRVHTSEILLKVEELPVEKLAKLRKCVLEGNVFMGALARKTRGVRKIFDENHIVSNNWFSDLIKGAILVNTGDGNEISGHMGAANITIRGNTIQECEDGLDIDSGYSRSNSAWWKQRERCSGFHDPVC